MNEENVAIRLKGFIDSLGLSSSQFADQCGIPRPSLSQLLSGRNKKISDVLVGQIHTAFPQLSVLWLLFGEGDMLVKSSGDDAEADDNDLSNNVDSNLPEALSNGKRTSGEDIPVSGRIVGGGLTVDKSNALLAEKEAEIEELRKEIERLKRNPRKVAQITVYYDDSTFETFYPASNGVRGGR